MSYYDEYKIKGKDFEKLKTKQRFDLVGAVNKNIAFDVDEIDFYAVVLDGDVQYASKDRDDAIGYVDNISDEEVEDIADELGRDIDDLTPYELGEMYVKAGYDGDAYDIVHVKVRDKAHGDIDTEIYYDDDKCLTYGDIVDTFVNLMNGDFDS